MLCFYVILLIIQRKDDGIQSDFMLKAGCTICIITVMEI